MSELSQSLSGEKELMKLGNITLTEKRVYQEVNSGNTKTMSIIPITNVDSFGLISTQKISFLILGVIVAVGALVALTQNALTGIMLFVLAAIFVAAWWFTKKAGVTVYSMSGLGSLFTVVPGSNFNDAVVFLNKLQTVIEAANASRQPVNVN